MLIDCHCHLSFPEFSADLNSILDELKPDFYAVIESTINLSNTEKALKLFADQPLIRFALGFHPYYAADCNDTLVARYAELIEENKRVVAVGEVGLDYKSEASFEAQKAAFERFIDLAKELDLALVIHNRGFKDKLLRIVKEKGIKKVIFHCFSQDKEFLQEVISCGFYVSFAGNLTYKNAHLLKEAAKVAPLDKILSETDCPYLAPQVIRGKRNDPGYVREVIKEIALLKGKGEQEVGEAVLENAKNIFKI
jgi:TatD DNase family protein